MVIADSEATVASKAFDRVIPGQMPKTDKMSGASVYALGAVGVCAEICRLICKTYD